jgi:lipid-A-disaccharide synthase
LPNILCRSFVVPELLQRECRPQELAQAVRRWFDDRSAVLALQQRFAALHSDLRRDTFTLATDAVKKVLAA